MILQKQYCFCMYRSLSVCVRVCAYDYSGCHMCTVIWPFSWLDWKTKAPVISKGSSTLLMRPSKEKCFLCTSELLCSEEKKCRQTSLRKVLYVSQAPPFVFAYFIPRLYPLPLFCLSFFHPLGISSNPSLLNALPLSLSYPLSSAQLYDFAFNAFSVWQEPAGISLGTVPSIPQQSR